MERSWLDRLDVAAPCPFAWDAMEGRGDVRFCGGCRQQVYDLSALTRGEAESLVRGHEGRLCVRFVRRSDGRVLTQDCGPLRAAVRRRLWRLRAAAAAVLGAVGLAGLVGCRSDAGGTVTTGVVAPPPETAPDAE